MKIIIVGAGISGLSLYLHLRKHLPSPPPPHPPHSITLYEAHRPRSTSTAIQDSSFAVLSSSTAIVGGGIGISPNGMRVLYSLSPELHAAVTAQGFRCEFFDFRSSRGWKLLKAPTSDKDVRRPDGEEQREEWCVASSRHGLWRVLMDGVSAEGGAVVYRKVVNAGVTAAGKPFVKFEDGTEEEANLVVGADGVWSAVKKGILDHEDERFRPFYEKLCGVGGFLDFRVPEDILHDRSMVFTFGANGFFGYSPYSPSESRMMWWSTYSETEAVPGKKGVDVDDIKRQLRERHKDWKDSVIQDIINANLDVDSIYPVFTTPELPHWGENGLVLVGDAAHALQPTSGQGASQALEDAQTLSLLLVHYLQKAYSEGGEISENDAIRMSSKLLYEIRAPRVKALADRARMIDARKMKQTIWAEMLLCLFLWLVGRFQWVGRLVLGDQHTFLYGWSAAEEIRKAVEKRAAPTSA